MSRDAGVWRCRYHGLLWLACLFVLFDPLVVHDISYWMSFYAVLVLIYLHSKDTKSGALSVFRWQVQLQFLLAPLALVFFGTVSWVSPLVNLLAVPLVGFVVLPGLLISAGFEFAGAHAVSEFVLDWILVGLEYVYDGLQRLSLWHGAATEMSRYGWVLICVALYLFRDWLKHWKVWMVACLLLVGVIMLESPTRPKSGEYEVNVLDVGQGLSVVVRTANHVLVYDTGVRFSNGAAVAESVLIPWLRQHRISKIDVLVISHGDLDHSGGYPAVTEAMDVVSVHSSDHALLGPYGLDCHGLPPWEFDGVVFSYLSAGKKYEEANNNSCVLRIAGPGGVFLLTGDIEKAAEGDLVDRYGDMLASNVMLAPHQGSNTSSRPVFLDRVRPQEVVIASGYLNAYGHPAGKVLQRYAGRSIRHRSTACEGTIRYTFESDAYHAESFRQSSPRYWRSDHC